MLRMSLRLGGLGLLLLSTAVLNVVPALGFDPTDREWNAPIGRLNTLSPGQWISIDVNGGINGRVMTLRGNSYEEVGEGYQVALVGNGAVLSSTSTTRDGKFRFQNVSTGVFTIVAKGKDAFAVYAITVLPPMLSERSSLTLVTAPGLGIEKLLPTLVSSLNPIGSASGPGFGPVYSETARRVVDSYRVQQSEAGGFFGTVSIPGVPIGAIDFSRMRVRIYRNGSQIDDFPVTAEGRYEVTEIGSGPFGAVFQGPNGFAVLGIEVVPGPQLTETLISFRNSTLLPQSDLESEFDVDIAPMADVMPILQQESLLIDSPGVLGAPSPGAFGGGGFGGGGGGFGGLGGLGVLAAAGGIIAGVEDDNGLPTVPPASNK